MTPTPGTTATSRAPAQSAPRRALKRAARCPLSRPIRVRREVPRGRASDRHRHRLGRCKLSDARPSAVMGLLRVLSPRTEQPRRSNERIPSPAAREALITAPHGRQGMPADTRAHNTCRRTAAGRDPRQTRCGPCEAARNDADGTRGAVLSASPSAPPKPALLLHHCVSGRTRGADHSASWPGMRG